MKAILNSRGFPAHDYAKGDTHATFVYAGREYIGTIQRVKKSGTGCIVCEMRHLNGEPWADGYGRDIEPRLLALDILERTYD